MFGRDKSNDNTQVTDQPTQITPAADDTTQALHDAFPPQAKPANELTLPAPTEANIEATPEIPSGLEDEATLTSSDPMAAPVVATEEPNPLEDSFVALETEPEEVTPVEDLSVPVTVKSTAIEQPEMPSFDEPVASDSIEAVDETPEPAEEPLMTSFNSPSLPTSSNNLDSLKQSIVKDLSPIVGHLDQTPEEKLKTVMMLYEATNDSALLTQAYEAAKGLSDDAARARALHDLLQKIEATA